jgi:hypothetical protein
MKDKHAHAGHKTKGRKRFWIILLSVVIVLIVVRAVLPYFVLRYVNNKLGNLKEYYGHVDDIDIALFRGAYIIKDIKLEKVDEQNKKSDTIPFFSSPVIDLSVEWNAIFKGSIVGEIYVEDPKLNFVKGGHKNEDVKADTADFRQIMKDLMPLTVNHFEISNGQIHYIDKDIKPMLDIALLDLEVTATNLSNVNNEGKLLPAHLSGQGNAYDGSFTINVDFDALNNIPTFDLNAELKRLNLVKINNFLKAYGNFEVSRGHFGLYTEFAARNGEFGGYVKPLIQDMKVDIWKKDEGLKQALWNLVVEGGAKLLENSKTNQVGTKVPIKGRFDKPYVNIWKAISYVIRNAFVHGLKPSIDNSININKLEDDTHKTFLEKIFGKKDKDKKEKK